MKWVGRRTAIGVAVSAVLALTAAYSASRTVVTARPADTHEVSRESRGFRFEVEDATVRRVDLEDSRVELTSDLLGIFGARLLVTDRTEILLGGLQAGLADLPEGARVRASYEMKDGLKIARTISAEKPEPEVSPPPAVRR